MSLIPGWANVSSLVLRLVLFAGVALCAQHAGPAWAGVIYVKAGATGANNGQSWTDAYTGLQAALSAAVAGDEIWIAKGTYKPTTGSDRSVSFVLKQEVGLYGGFAGTETDRAQRNWETNATILSGDIGTAEDAADNTYHVVRGAELAVLDGLTITGGNTGAFGGGMYNGNCSPTVTNCTFSGNTALDGGGGMLNDGGSPTVTNCAFSGNTTNYRGGGMHNYYSSPTVTNCTFSDNTAGSSGYGGGMSSYYSSPTVTNCTFSNNSPGGMFNDGSLATVTSCTFSGNTTGGVGGGMFNYFGSSTVTNCTFSSNTAGAGGGMDNYRTSPTVTNCTFSGNTVASFGDGGGMHNFYSSPTVTNCAFSGNTVGAFGDGGGMYNRSNSSPTVTNCTFSGNSADSGGGMYNDFGSPTVTNCTFSDNTAGSYGGGMYNLGGLPTVTNCIFWDNTAPLGAEIYRDVGTPTFSHCDIKGSGGSGALWNPALGADGGGNIMANPRFVAPATPAGPDGLWRTRDDGLRLQPDSPCIGAADPAVAPGTDILGLTRKTAPDIGAYEFDWTRTSTGPAWLLFR